ncbi:MAG: hypothetical protein QXD73_05415 [Candidatus Bathyarchaeia archaeon]
MLGFYENFPVNVHMTALLTTTISTKKLQQAIIQALHKLNGESLNLEAVTNPSLPECTAIFEFGIAESKTFNYLDQKEAQRALEEIGKTPLRVIDFFCAIRYYKRRESENKPLKFDYYMLRLIFSTDIKAVEIHVYHERGPRHVSPEEIVNFIVSRVNAMFPRKALKFV